MSMISRRLFKTIFFACQHGPYISSSCIRHSNQLHWNSLSKIHMLSSFNSMSQLSKWKFLPDYYKDQVAIPRRGAFTPFKAIMKAKAAAKGQKENKLQIRLLNALRGSIYAAGGETDPKKNSKLAEVILQCQKHQIAASMIQKAISSTKEVKEEVTLFVKMKSGVSVVVKGYARDRKNVRGMLNSAVRKSKSQAQVLDNDEDFEKKGVIVVDLPIDGKELSEDEAMNLAIEIGAEDVIHEIDSLKFICGEKDWVNPRKALMDQGIQPISAGGEIIAKELSEFSEAAIEEVEKIIDAFHSKIQSQGTPYQSLYINNNVSSKKS